MRYQPVAKDDFTTAIRNRNAARVCALLLDDAEVPRLIRGAGTENELWDYKADLPSDAAGWARLARHVLAFHNNRGGVLLFGIRDGDLAFSGANGRMDSKVFNDKIRQYIGDQIWVDFHREYIQPDQRYLGLAIIPPRGPMLGFFRKDAPLVGGRREFRKGDSARRVGDSSLVMSQDDAYAHQATSSTTGIVGSPYAIDIPFFRVFALETHEFIARTELGAQVERALVDPRTSVTSLIGIGGSGKTTLGTWAVLKAYEKKQFDFIVSITAKDRELTSVGIQSLSTSPTTFEVLLDGVLDVLGYEELADSSVEEREEEVRQLLTGSNALLYVDNLETVDDSRVIRFLDDLPIGVRGLVTSRRATVRVAVRPVDVGPFSAKEARALIHSLRNEAGTGYVADLSEAEVDRIAAACDRLPLAIRWTLMRAGSAAEAVHRAESLRSSGDRDEQQLLEFVFRRVFDGMSDVEKAVMQTLSIFTEPSPTETLVAGTGQKAHAVVDALEDLARDALAQRFFDPSRNDHVYGLAPLTRSFVLAEIRKDRKVEELIRHRLSGWYEALDVKSSRDRAVAREMRQGRGSTEQGLVDLAQAAEKSGDFKSAQDMYEQALSRNPKSWYAARRLAEFERRVNLNRTRALELYERAAANAPATGADRALVFREWGMLLRDSGQPTAVTDAIEKFEVARLDTPNDAILVHALASLYDRRGVYRKVIELVEPFARSPSPKSRAMFLRLLVRAYDSTGAILEAAESRRDLRDTEELLKRK